MKRLILKSLFTIVSCAAFIGVLPMEAIGTLAASEESLSMDESNVSDDLQGSTIEGKEFSLSDYPPDSTKAPELLSFIEYAYSYDPDRQENFNLYAYIYNPSGKEIDRSAANKITVSCGTNGYVKYPLQFINYSAESGSEGLFYKFKLTLTVAQRMSMLNSLNPANRQYTISEFELCYKNESVKSYTVGKTYNYSGYGKGYGTVLGVSDSLQCTVDGNVETISPKVYHTYYKPEGHNGTEYTYDKLASVYFNVPNRYINEYGEMEAIRATWLDAVTNPILVTGNKEAHDAILPYIGHKFQDNDDYNTLSYAYSDAKLDTKLVTDNKTYYDAKYRYIIPDKFWDGFTAYDQNVIRGSTFISTLNYIFYSGSEKNSADNYTLKSEVLLDYMETYSDKNRDYVSGTKYSKSLFKSYDSDYTVMDLKSNDTFDLTSCTLKKLFYFKNPEYNNEYESIKVIQKVESCVSAAQVEADYKVNKEDFSTFASLFNDTDSTLYVFHYAVDDLYKKEAMLFKHNIFGWQWTDTNAYFCEQSVYLGFDIIQLTFSKNGTETVIGVVNTPKDVVHDITPPIEVTPDPEPLPGVGDIFEGISEASGSLAETLKKIMASVLTIMGIIFVCIIIGLLLPLIISLVSTISSLFKKNE